MRRILLISACMLPILPLNAQLRDGTPTPAPRGSSVQLVVLSETLLQAMNPPPSAGEVCRACKRNCVDAREQCKLSACLVNGGTPNGLACDSVANEKGWSDGLKTCSDEETACDNKCSNGPCKQ
jgi:hypothetical protein